MKKFLFLTAREWIVVVGIIVFSASATILWIGYAKPICAIPVTPDGFMIGLRQDLQKGRHFTRDQLAARYSEDRVSRLYPMAFSGSDDHLILVLTPKTYSIGWGVHGSRFKYEFDTQTLKTKVYDEQGVCFYTEQ